MSAAKSRMFIFTDRSTGRVLKIKQSLGLDFSFNGRDWICTEVASQGGIPLKADSSYSWDVLRGLVSIGPLPEAELPRWSLLSRKVEILLAVRSNLHVIWMQMSPQFASGRIAAAPVHRQSFKKFWRLMITEKKQARRKINSFFLSVRDKIESAESLAQLERDYSYMINNFILGGYAAMSLDIEENHVKKNDLG